MAALNPSPITALSDRFHDLAESGCTTADLKRPDERRTLLMLDLVRALARQAAAEAWGRACPDNSPENTP